MNEKERQIIEHLRKDARISLAKISQDIGMPISTIHDKVRRFENIGLIKGSSISVDFSKLGFNYLAKIAIKVSKSSRAELISFIQNDSSVNSIHEVNGTFDFMIETAHKDVKEYLNFVEKLTESFSLEAIQEFQVIGEIKRD